MDIKIFPKPLHGTITAIPAKSHLHRVLIASSLSENTGAINTSRFLKSKDIEATKSCLKQISKYQSGDNAVLYCGESATTLRLILPIVCAKGLNAIFCGEKGLKNRPLGPLLETLEANGITYSTTGSLPKQLPADLPILSEPEFICSVSNNFTSGKFALPGDISSQYVSGLLFASPFVGFDSIIAVKKPCQSYSYINLTLEILELFGINIKKSEDNDYIFFYIKANQTYICPDEIDIEGDWSNGAFWLGADYFTNEDCHVTIKGLPENTKQGDKKILDFIESLKLSTPDKETVFSIEDCPDLGPILAVLAAGTEGTFVIENAGRLKIKESDRLAALVHNLSLLGVDIQEAGTGLIIKGQKSFKGDVVLDSFNDHRIVMALAVASLKCDAPITIKQAQAVNKSYPSFFEDFKKLKGDYILP